MNNIMKISFALTILFATNYLNCQSGRYQSERISKSPCQVSIDKMIEQYERGEEKCVS